MHICGPFIKMQLLYLAYTTVHKCDLCTHVLCMCITYIVCIFGVEMYFIEKRDEKKEGELIGSIPHRACIQITYVKTVQIVRTHIHTFYSPTTL